MIVKIFKRGFSNVGDYISGWLLSITILLLIFLLILTVSLAITFISLDSGIIPLPIYKMISDTFIVLLIPSIPLDDKETYIKSLSLILNVFIIILPLFLAMLPIISVFKYRRDVRKSKYIKSNRILRDGVDDIEIMYKNFLGAEEVIVHSGDFDWIGKNKKLSELFVNLAKNGKLKLRSYKTKEQVETAINDDTIISKLSDCFIYECEDRLKCSFIKRRSLNQFLYKYETYEDGERSSFVFELIDSDQTRYLLEILENFIN